MGAMIAKMLESPQVRQDRMFACLRLMHKVLLSQLGTLAVEGVLLGYYLTNMYLIFRQEFESEEVISPACPLCRTSNFELLCRGCRAVLGCEGCVAGVEGCGRCGARLGKGGVIKVFMN